MRTLFIKQKVFKLTDHYPIVDEEGKPYYYVDQIIGFPTSTYIISDSYKNELFVITPKVLSFFPSCDVEFYNGELIQICTRPSLFRRKIEIIAENYNLSLVGSFGDYNFDIHNDNDTIATIDRKFSFSDQYAINIFNEQYQDIIIALAIALDRFLDGDRK